MFIGLPFECPEQCGYRGISLHSIKHHTGHYHSKKRAIYCKNGCGKVFTLGHSMNYHAKRHCPLNPVMKEELIKQELESGKKERKMEIRKRTKARVKELFKAHNLPM